MRVVQRRHTAAPARPQSQLEFHVEVEDPTETPFELHVPPAPWTWRSQVPEGAPRVCRSNFAYPVRIPGRTGTVEVGVIDRRLQMYSHWGLTEQSALIKIGDQWHVIYDFETEWQVVEQYGFWLEFVSDSRETVARISREDAERFGHKMEHGDRTKWAVPMKHYSVHRRQQ